MSKGHLRQKFCIFVTFWDSFMTHVLTWRNPGSVLYYGFSHLTDSPVFEHMILFKFTTFCLIYRGQGLERNNCWLHCRNDLPEYAKMDQLMQNCKSSSKIRCKSWWYQATCAHSQLPALAAETLSASLTWNILHSTSTPWSDENSTHDTWQFMVASTRPIHLGLFRGRSLDPGGNATCFWMYLSKISMFELEPSKKLPHGIWPQTQQRLHAFPSDGWDRKSVV